MDQFVRTTCCNRRRRAHNAIIKRSRPRGNSSRNLSLGCSSQLPRIGQSSRAESTHQGLCRDPDGDCFRTAGRQDKRPLLSGSAPMTVALRHKPSLPTEAAANRGGGHQFVLPKRTTQPARHHWRKGAPWSLSGLTNAPSRRACSGRRAPKRSVRCPPMLRGQHYPLESSHLS